ncbi:PE family protein, partial [Mycobacterium riyadhense]
MSFVNVVPELVAAAAADLAAIGSKLTAVNAAAEGPTTALTAAASDEVSAAVAALFANYAQQYQSVGAQAEVFRDRLVQALTTGAGAYAGTEVANAQQALLDAINAPTLALLGRPLIGNGADGGTVDGTGQPGGAGGLLYGNGGAGGAST